MIDLKSRVKNKTFWVGVISGLLVLIFNILDLCGVKTTVTTDELMNTVQIFLTLLTMFGVLVDTSTPGIADNKGSDNNDSVSK